MADKRDPIAILEAANAQSSGAIGDARRALETYATVEARAWTNVRLPLIQRLSLLINDIDRAKTRVDSASHGGLVSVATRNRKEMFDLRQDLRKAGSAGKKQKHSKGESRNTTRGTAQRSHGSGPRRGGGGRW